MEDKILDLKEEIIKHRRTLHIIPEMAFEETKTSQYVKKTLKKYGFEIESVAKTGVIGYKAGEADQRPIAFRADMDALEIKEKTKVPFVSKHEGYMHACGHDGHMAMLLGLAKYLSEFKKLKRDVVLVFQPGEENAGGAEVVLEDENFKKYNIKYIFGMHIFPNLEQGKIGIKSGPFYAQDILTDIIIKASGSHGALPENGVDGIYVASQLINSYQSIVSRNISALDSPVVSIGKMEAGNVRNALAEEVKLEGIIRSYKDSVFETVKKRMQEINRGLEKMFDVKIELTFSNFCPAVVNDNRLYNIFKDAIDDKYLVEMDPLSITEDFGFYQQKIPGFFFCLGSKNEEEGYDKFLHQSKFNFDDNLLLKGVEVYIKLCKKFNIV